MRPLIMKLATKISVEAKSYTGITVNDPEYRILEPVVTDEMAEVALAAKVRKNMTAQEIAKRCKKPLEETKKLLWDLAVAGVMRVHSENGTDYYMLPIWVPGIMEMMVANKEQAEKYPVMAECFEEYTRRRTRLLGPNVPVGKGLMRVIPVEEAIDGENHAASYEEVSTYIENAWRLCVSDCTCRRSRRLMGEGCGHLEKDMCIQLDEGADYFIRTGVGREITKEEAYEILKRAEENGLVHEIQNLDGEGKTVAICNCCSCSCFSLRVGKYYMSPDFNRSNYVSSIDAEKCVACGQCVENCQVNALHLGRKLCAKTPVPEKEKDTPHDHVWMLDKKRWNTQFRYNRDEIDENGTAPCKTNCPAHIAVQGYIKLAAQGKYRDALELIKKNNPFPAVCGHICNRRCEDACSRADVDEPVAIDEIKKFIAEQELREENRYVPKMQNPQGEKYGRKIAVVGGGPGGLSCAFYLQQRGYDVTVFEKNDRPGGMLVFGIPAFRLEKDVVEAEIEVLRQMGVEFRMNTEVGKDITIRELRMQGYEAFYLAIGAQGGRRLGVEGEDASGVLSGVEFLRKMNLHEALKLEGRTVVVGGGNVAIDVARTAVRAGSSEVGLYCLESEKEMPAQEEEQQEAKEEGISLNHGWGPKRILAEDGKVKGIEFKRCTRVFDEEHRFHPQYDEADTVIVECDNILVSIGQSIQWGTMLDGTRVRVRRNQAAMADEKTYQTGEPDIFVGGDAYTGPKFAIDAIAAGKEAAESIHRYVQPGQSLLIGRPAGKYHELDKENVDWDSFDHTPRQQPKKPDPAKAKETMRDLRGTFTEEQVKKETERCLGCGATVVDQNVCVGCGICTTKCKFDAVHLERRYDAHEVPYEKLIVNHMAPTLMKRGAKIAARKAKDITLSRKRRQN